MTLYYSELKPFKCEVVRWEPTIVTLDVQARNATEARRKALQAVKGGEGKKAHLQNRATSVMFSRFIQGD